MSDAPIEAAEAGERKPDLADLGFAQGYAAAVAELRAMADRAFGDDSRRLLLCLAKDLEVIRRHALREPDQCFGRRLQLHIQLRADV